MNIDAILGVLAAAGLAVMLGRPYWNQHQYKKLLAEMRKHEDISPNELAEITGMREQRIQALLRGMEMRGDLCRWTRGPDGYQKVCAALPE